jgi:hypothetical protein
MKRMNFPRRKEQRRKEAEERNAKFQKLKFKEQAERNSRRWVIRNHYVGIA